MRNQGKFKKMLEENPGIPILTDNPERMKERIRSAGLDPDDYTIVDSNQEMANTNPANLVEALKIQLDAWMMQTVRKVPFPHLFEEQDQPKNNHPIVWGTPIPGDYDQKLDCTIEIISSDSEGYQQACREVDATFSVGTIFEEE